MRNGGGDPVVTITPLPRCCTHAARQFVGEAGWQAAYSQPMMISPGFTIKITLLPSYRPRVSNEGKSVFATLSARVGSIGDNKLGGWISYRSAKSALNQITRTSAIEIARLRSKSVVVALHPGSVDTGFSGGFSKAHDKIQPTESVAMMLSVLDGLEPAQTGGFFAYDGQPIEW